jgi:hypothetical protein
MASVLNKSLTPKEIDEAMEGKDEKTTTKVFCIDGVVVEIPLREALKRLPYGVEPMQRTMHVAIAGHGNEAHFLSAMTSGMLLHDVPSGKALQNINKDTVNTVASILGGKEVFGPDEDGVLK